MSCNVWGVVCMQVKNEDGADEHLFRLSSDLCYIGKGADCYIQVPDDRAADQHCLLMRDPEGQAWLTNVGSGRIIVNQVDASDDMVPLRGGETFCLCAEDTSPMEQIEFTFNFSEERESTDNTQVTGNADLTDSETVDKTEITKNIAISSTPVKADITSPITSSMESNLTCVICACVFFECHSLQPCLHSFCHLCCLRWLNVNSICPVCRLPVRSLAKNHQLDNLASLFIQQHPDRGLSDKEKASIRKEIEKLKSVSQSFTRSNAYVETDSSGSMSPISPLSMGHSSLACPICGSGGYYPSTSGNSSSPCTSHDICACCQRAVPAFVRDQSSVNQVQCEICYRSFCALISPHGCLNCSGNCLSLLSDLRNMTVLPPDLLLHNTIETSILKDYLSAKAISAGDFIGSCLDDMDPTLFGSAELTEQSPVCRECGLHCLSLLAYQRRVTIPLHELPTSVTSRPDCYYGRNCRTQKTNPSHAHRYNHICEQTRF